MNTEIFYRNFNVHFFICDIIYLYVYVLCIYEDLDKSLKWFLFRLGTEGQALVHLVQWVECIVHLRRN